jgi:hypothetical protein
LGICSARKHHNSSQHRSQKTQNRKILLLQSNMADGPANTACFTVDERRMQATFTCASNLWCAQHGRTAHQNKAQDERKSSTTERKPTNKTSMKGMSDLTDTLHYGHYNTIKEIVC